MAQKRSKKYARIGGVLPEVARHHGWAAKLDMHSFFPKWAEIVDEDVATCSRPLKIVKDVLWLEVESSAWMQQLQFEKMRILEAVNATLKIARLKDIKFVLARGEAETQSHEPPELNYDPPGPEELKKFEAQVEVIEDEKIRDSLVRLWYLAKACKRKPPRE